MYHRASTLVSIFTTLKAKRVFIIFCAALACSVSLQAQLKLLWRSSDSLHELRSLAISPDGAHIAAGGWNGEFSIFASNGNRLTHTTIDGFDVVNQVGWVSSQVCYLSVQNVHSNSHTEKSQLMFYDLRTRTFDTCSTKNEFLCTYEMLPGDKVLTAYQSIKGWGTWPTYWSLQIGGYTSVDSSCNPVSAPMAANYRTSIHPLYNDTLFVSFYGQETVDKVWSTAHWTTSVVVNQDTIFRQLSRTLLLLTDHYNSHCWDHRRRRVFIETSDTLIAFDEAEHHIAWKSVVQHMNNVVYDYSSDVILCVCNDSTLVPVRCSDGVALSPIQLAFNVSAASLNDKTRMLCLASTGEYHVYAFELDNTDNVRVEYIKEELDSKPIFAHDILRLKGSYNEVSLYTLMGCRVATFAMTHDIDMQNFAPGLYYCTMSCGERSRTVLVMRE